jgi:hypothetical protein
MRLLTEFHDGSCTELLLDHSECGIQGFFAIIVHNGKRLEKEKWILQDYIKSEKRVKTIVDARK